MHHLFIGIVVSLLVAETTGYSAGGIVAAGYLSLFAGQPTWLASTALAALLTYALVRILETRLLLFGRRLFAVYVLVGLIVSQLAMLLSRGGMFFDWGIIVIGFLIPGLIARDFGRQGIVATSLATALAVALTSLVVLAGDGWLW